MLFLIEIPPPQAWDWVAIGTFLLAAATFGLAIFNRKVVEVSQRQLETAREDLALARQQSETARETLEVQTAPLLASVPWGVERQAVLFLADTGEAKRFEDASKVTVSQGTVNNDQRVRISVPFRNVGNGVAVITEVKVMIGGRLFDGTPGAPVLPPGEIARAWVDAGRQAEIFEWAISLAVDGCDFAVAVGYADAGGIPRGALSLDIHREGPGSDSWRVRRMHLGENPEDALSRPSLSSPPL